MTFIRRHWFGGFFAATALLLITVGLDAQPADLAETAPPPTVRTRTVEPQAALADLPQEDGRPVFPADQEQPRRLTFTFASEPVRLIEEQESVQRLGAVQRIVISTIELDTEVVQVGVVRSDGDLRYEIASEVVGQYRGVNPGEGGNVVLAGHVGTRDGRGGAVFRDLDLVELGDSVEVYSDIGLREYVVTEIRFVEATATQVMDSTGAEQLTLITCRNCNVDCQRLVVIAEPAPNPESV